MKAYMFLLATLFSLMLISVATAVTVQPGETRDLPQVSSDAMDLEGIDRTYLYCTWEIGGLGQEIVEMTTPNCPENPVEFTFEEDQTYLARIDSAHFLWDTNAEAWRIVNNNLEVELTEDYVLDLPEPEPALFTSVINSIRNTIHATLCTLFPWLNVCQ